MADPIPVTDPNILQQLNAGSETVPTGMQPVSDPSVLAQLNGEQQPTLMDNLGQTWPREYLGRVHLQPPLI